MVPNSDLVLAWLLSEKAHAGQLDKAGEPYIQHPRRVADCFSDTKLKIIALLHDTVEDTWVDEKLLRKMFSSDVCDCIMLLTRKNDETYSEFINRIVKSKNLYAIKIKIADITDNMNLGRLKEVTAKDLERTQKYAESRILLKEALIENESTSEWYDDVY